MSLPNNKNASDAITEFLRRGLPGSNEALVHEISELRKEIAELRADLAPVPSLIVTGRAALDEFRKLVESR